MTSITPTASRRQLTAMLTTQPQRLRRRSISLGVHPDDADDAAQIAALRAWRAVDTVQHPEPGPLCSWLDTIARNTAIDLHRNREATLGEVHCETLRANDDVEAEAEIRERLTAVLRAIRSLPPELREPLLLSAVDGKSAPEIAATLDLTPAAVRQRIARARKALR